MPRSSRHISHREHMYGERADSGEDRDSRDRKERVEVQGSSSRVSRDLESEKRKSSYLPQPGGEDMPVEHGRKRKYREEDSAASDRLNGAREDDRVADLGRQGETFGLAESEKATKSKLSSVASRERSRRRLEDSAERYEDGSSKVELTKRRSEKDLSRESSLRESSSQYKDAKEKGRERGSEKDLSRGESSSHQYKDAKEKERDRGFERDKKVHGSRHERPDDVGSQVAKTGCSEEERALKKDKEHTGDMKRLHGIELQTFQGGSCSNQPRQSMQSQQSEADSSFTCQPEDGHSSSAQQSESQHDSPSDEDVIMDEIHIQDNLIKILYIHNY